MHKTVSPPATRPSTTALPAFDADVSRRADRTLDELAVLLPEVEGQSLLVADLLRRMLHEQDRASRTDEVLRRFSPALRHHVEHRLNRRP